MRMKENLTAVRTEAIIQRKRKESGKMMMMIRRFLKENRLMDSLTLDLRPDSANALFSSF
jgi:hypothetical protein